MKIDFKDGWVHLRKSNTEPIIRIYSESKDEAAANQLAEDVIKSSERVCIDEKEGVSKVILFQKTPPSLRATSSINRGGAGDSPRRQEYFNSPSVYRGSTPKGREFENDF